jgi:hypothetical protein
MAMPATAENPPGVIDSEIGSIERIGYAMVLRPIVGGVVTLAQI